MTHDITITRVGPGWLAACAPCRWEACAPFRPGADKAAWDHERQHKPRREAE